MAQNPLRQLLDFGQSFWYDNIRRSLIFGGELKRMIDEDGLRGLTSNPTIFAKAIAGSADYDASIRRHLDDTPGQVFLELEIEDIGAACDLFRPVYDASQGRDGFCSIEVFPDLARDAAATVAQAREIWRRLNRPNVMVKVPSTPECIPAIRQLLTDGININITLMFDFAAYQAVLEAYLTALEARLAQGQPIQRLAAVASLFVSRVDTRLDRKLADLAKQNPGRAAALEQLEGKSGIANSQRMYQHFLAVTASARWQRLAAAGARPQRLLWASTSTKNPKYPDTVYADALVAPDTVDTMPDVTVAAFRDHGHPGDNLRPTLAQAEPVLAGLAQAGIDFEAELRGLQDEGVDLFTASYNELLETLQGKIAQLKGDHLPAQSLAAQNEKPFQNALSQMEKAQAGRRIWAKDAALWSPDAAVGEKIRNRLGWLDLAGAMRPRLPEIQDFIADCKKDGLRAAVLLGMGGSSLAPEVYREIFSAAGLASDRQLHVLDTTDPAAIAHLAAQLDFTSTLFLVSSKSGGTIEPNSLFAYFWGRVGTALKAGQKPGRYFAAITDPGTSLEKLAGEHGFRHVFTNPPDIGGRYSALSLFGLVPAAWLGIDLTQLLDRAEAMQKACGANVRLDQNPGVQLGSFLGGWALAGRDKITLLASPALASFGSWAEQLIAESTGKLGKGLVPVDGEPAGLVSDYGSDRVFIRLRLASEAIPGDDWAAAQMKAGAPVATLALRDAYDLGAEYYRWEFATAVAGAVLGINPFDEPNVQESKDNTSRVLQTFLRQGARQAGLDAAPTARDQEKGMALSALAAYEDAAQPAASSVAAALARLLESVRPGDYVALMVYSEASPRLQSQLRALRVLLRGRLKVATTLGFGPRFLHSTGQLHKGGPNTGVFLQLTSAVAAASAGPVAIPGQQYDFATLFQAQAIGDFQSLAAHKRRVLRIDLGADLPAGLARLLELTESVLGAKQFAGV